MPFNHKDKQKKDCENLFAQMFHYLLIGEREKDRIYKYYHFSFIICFNIP